jgi:hypothetical protein
MWNLMRTGESAFDNLKSGRQRTWPRLCHSAAIFGQAAWTGGPMIQLLSQQRDLRGQHVVSSAAESPINCGCESNAHEVRAILDQIFWQALDSIRATERGPARRFEARTTLEEWRRTAG